MRTKQRYAVVAAAIAALGSPFAATGGLAQQVEQATAVGAPAPADIAAGAYVATAAGCESCHSGDAGYYAGGRLLQTPFGGIAVPNITQDAETGIGNYTFEQFTATIHEGLRDDGAPLYPAMPYLHYTKMTDADVAALWAFIKTIPPVRNEVDVNRLPFPYDVRESLIAWRALYLDKGRYEPEPAKSDEWNRGSYLVHALAHCEACHTPRDPLGGPIDAQALKGADIEEWWAPDISNGPNSVIAHWDVERLTGFLRGNDGLNHVAVGSMALVVTELSQLREDDVRSIAVYLKDQPPAEERDPPETTATGLAPVELGRSIFENRCVSCHQDTGTGAAGIAASLVDAGGVEAQSPRNVIAVLLEGIAPNRRYGVMPSFSDSLTDNEIAAVTNYVRTAWGNTGVPNAATGDVRGLRNVTEVSKEVKSGAFCPTVPHDAVDGPLREQISALAGEPAMAAGGPPAAKVDPLVAAFRAGRPGAVDTDVIVDLGGLYCQDLVINNLPRDAAMLRSFEFMSALGTAVKR